ncbi:MAG: type II toxin-antitoxin system Phd/YefM family antitoxin [Chloroflexota bacterium]|nr:MAG: prevent-host-death protein [Chloroflexota bacterium]
MTREVSYSWAREPLSELWDRALADREAVRVTRRGTGAVVLLAEDEYDGLLETAHLLHSPANATRLLSALERAQAGDGEPKALDELRAGFPGAEGI